MSITILYLTKVAAESTTMDSGHHIFFCRILNLDIVWDEGSVVVTPKRPTKNSRRFGYLVKWEQQVAENLMIGAFSSSWIFLNHPVPTFRFTLSIIFGKSDLSVPARISMGYATYIDGLQWVSWHPHPNHLNNGIGFAPSKTWSKQHKQIRLRYLISFAFASANLQHQWCKPVNVSFRRALQLQAPLPRLQVALAQELTIASKAFPRHVRAEILFLPLEPFHIFEMKITQHNTNERPCHTLFISRRK